MFHKLLGIHTPLHAIFQSLDRFAVMLMATARFQFQVNITEEVRWLLVLSPILAVRSRVAWYALHESHSPQSSHRVLDDEHLRLETLYETETMPIHPVCLTSLPRHSLTLSCDAVPQPVVMHRHERECSAVERSEDDIWSAKVPQHLLGSESPDVLMQRGWKPRIVIHRVCLMTSATKLPAEEFRATKQFKYLHFL